MPAFFSWEIEPVLFFLAEKEKNGFKKAFLWVRRKPEEAGGQGRPPLHGAAENRGLYRTRKMVPDRHHQDRVRRVVGLREVTRGGQIRPGK